MNYTQTDINRGIEALTPRPTGRESLVLDSARLHDVVRYLLHYGYAAPKADKVGWVQAVRKAQEILGLVVDGVPGIVTERAMLSTPRCARPDLLGLATGLNQWAKRKATQEGLTYHVTRYVRNIRQDTQEEELKAAFQSWQDVSRLRFERLHSSQADILIGASDSPREEFGSPGAVLAWAQLPRGSNHRGQLVMKMDLAEPWVTDLSEGGRGILYRNVAAHEIGHLLGLEHTQIRGELLFPTYAASVSKPQAKYDIPEAVKRYGEPDGSVPDNSGGWFKRALCAVACSACKNFCGGCQ